MTSIDKAEKALLWRLVLTLTTEPPAKVAYSVIPAKAEIQNSLKIPDSGSRFAFLE
jgi:hypothetical protein